MKMFFYRFETQPAFIGNLLVAVPIAHQARQISFSARKPGQMRQGSAASLISLCAALAQILELDKKLRPRDSGRANLFQTDSRAKIVPRRQTVSSLKWTGAMPSGLSCSHRFLRTRH